MPELTVAQFIDVIQRSRLIEKDQLAAAIADCREGNGNAFDIETVSAHLKASGLLTEWQSKNLLKGRTKGFFLGDYKLQNHLGTGGMSSVFLAKHRLIDRPVAIKILPPSRAEDPNFRDRFEREARATALLSHPNIVRVFDIDTQGDTHYIVMEYVSGRDLRAIVKSGGPLPLDRAAHYIAQAAVGLQHAHQRGLVHRDIKPANLVAKADGTLKILDLGLARVDDDEISSLTMTNPETMMGTADYLAPEQALNAHTVDGRADVYSLGCTFYFLLTGHAPFTEGTIAQRILMHQTQPPRDVRADRPDCPHALADCCMTMLAKEPERRVPVETIASRLGGWLESNGHSIANATYASTNELQVDQELLATLRPDVEAPTTVDAEQTLTESRKARERRRIKTPTWIWFAIGGLVLFCLFLAAYALSL